MYFQVIHRERYYVSKINLLILYIVSSTKHSFQVSTEKKYCFARIFRSNSDLHQFLGKGKKIAKKKEFLSSNHLKLIKKGHQNQNKYFFNSQNLHKKVNKFRKKNIIFHQNYLKMLHFMFEIRIPGEHLATNSPHNLLCLAELNESRCFGFVGISTHRGMK